jgi:hypothetical protein
LNSYGYVLIALVSRSLFYWLSDIQAIVLFQLLIHILICLFFCVFLLDSAKARFLFIALYAANPLVIHFVTFPFYYFWLCVPSVSFAALVLKPIYASRIILLSTPLLLLSLLIRPTTIFLCLLTYFFALRIFPAKRRALWILSFATFVAGILVFSHFNPRLPPYHTMYIGFGAYSNHIGINTLSDNEGFRYFTSKTGIEISTNPINGNWGNPDLMKSYNHFLKDRYLEILSTSPGLALKNLLLNCGQVFSLGYIVKSANASLLSSFFGFAVIIFLLFRNQLVWVLAILASALSFFWYFPPIPAYNFAAYLLLVCAILSSLNLTNKV